MEGFWLQHKAGELGAEIVARFDDQLIEHTDPVRPGFNLAVSYCENDKADFLIVYWMPTINFPGFDLAGLTERLAGFGTQIVFCHAS